MALATVMGGELARRALGEDTVLPVTPPHPIPFHRFWRLGVAAAVAKGRVQDRLGL